MSGPSRINIPIPIESSDGLYHGRYPNGAPAILAGAATDATSASGALTVGGGGSGATPVFSYADFSSSPSTISLPGDGSGFVNNAIGVCTGAVGAHEAGAGWYKTQQNISGGFTTQFTFQISQAGPGVCFVVQNTPDNGNPQGFYGVNLVGDANMSGYGAYDLTGQYFATNSIAIQFSTSSQNGNAQDYPNGGVSATLGLYINGGSKGVFTPELDLTPYGINILTFHLMACTVTYDGSFITLVIQDTVTLAQARFTWPLNIPTAIGGNLAWVGFTGGDPPGCDSVNQITSWGFSTGYNPRLATPTFSGSPPSISINYPAGSTCYYTTNGLEPTTASRQYTGPITVSSNQVLKAIAIQSGFTDSFVGTQNYIVSGANTINFGSGFSGASGLITTIANASFSGSVLNIVNATDKSTGYSIVGAAWFVAPIPISSFDTTFVFTSNSSVAAGSGLCFVIQNQNGTSTDATALTVSGGPFAVGGSGFGYAQRSGTGTDAGNGFLTSVAICFDVQENTVGVVTNGALPTTGDSISGISLDSGHSIQAHVVYSGTTITVNLKDLTTSVTAGPFTFTENIQSVVGGSTAYVGFTYAMGYVGSSPSFSTTQTINSWAL